nr:MAG TPA: hypothetical protein [Caudoviricetes sp.]DAW30341.1 MAG TPA: hypothetical protein [Caudoviricetes sp.]
MEDVRIQGLVHVAALLTDSLFLLQRTCYFACEWV